MTIKNKKIKLNAGMTYVELIVVLSIFAVMSAVVVFNYNKFQAKVDIKNLANDIALKIVEAQKSAMNGKLASQPFSPEPAYGVHFDSISTNRLRFIFYADYNNDNLCGNSGDGHLCLNSSELLDNIGITKGNYISGLNVFFTSGSPYDASGSGLDFTFTRPNSGAVIAWGGAVPQQSSISYAQITVASPQGFQALIKIYTSGRIQIN